MSRLKVIVCDTPYQALWKGSSKYIVLYMEQNELFNLGQHGIRLGRSCLSQLIAHYDGTTQMLGEGQSVDVVYLDFAKAFDKVDFLMVMKKLQHLGISGKMGRWIHSFLTSRTQTVIVNGVKFFVTCWYHAIVRPMLPDKWWHHDFTWTNFDLSLLIVS